MKTEDELNNEILETTINIQENYPELSKFADEMTITIPSEKNPEITTKALKEYNDSLLGIATEYAKHSIKRTLLSKLIAFSIPKKHI